MRQEEIVNEIRKKCGHVEMLPSMGWHFIYHDRHFFYMTGRSEGMIRFCVPHLVKANEYNAELLSEAINETNRSVKFIKAVKLDCGSVSLDYNHKTASDESADLTSSMRHPKIFIKQRSYTFMSFHQHCFVDDQFAVWQCYLYSHYCLCKCKNFVNAH